MNLASNRNDSISTIRMSAQFNSKFIFKIYRCLKNREGLCSHSTEFRSSPFTGVRPNQKDNKNCFFLLYNSLLRTMHKRLKFESLPSPRHLRSGKLLNSNNVTTKTSAYFNSEKSSAENKPKLQRKKRTPIKIKYENEDEKTDAKHSAISVENTHGTEFDIKQEIKTEIPSPVKNEFDDGATELPVSQIKSEDSKSDTEDTKDVKTIQHKWTPTNWEIMLKNIREMRKYQTAPVDDMGCHKCADPAATDKVQRFQSLVALMLSSQTKDQVTHAAMQRLNTHGCTPESIINTPDTLLGEIIYPVGFWKKKVDYLKRVAQILIDKYESDIPRTAQDLCKLPGVGPKMAHICMQVAWGEVSGIGIDTHVHRICNRIGWVKKPTKVPEETRIALEDWLPKELWTEINHLLVGFGQEICLPRFPQCAECLNKNICPFPKTGKKKQSH